MFSFTLRVLCNLAYPKKAMKRDRKATALCADGRSDEEIKRMGRWKSSAFQGYIRVC
jgi:hypothetical protein